MIQSSFRTTNTETHKKHRGYWEDCSFMIKAEFTLTASYNQKQITET